MEIYISEEDILQNIEDKFQAVYPNLKLEFYVSEDFHRPFMLDASLDDIRMVHTFGWLDISADKTTAELQEVFKNEFALHVQVFRKTMYTWQKVADGLTLAQQNELAYQDS
jgi:hypothetical protein